MRTEPASTRVAASPFEQALAAVPVPVAILDGDLRFRFVNDAMAGLDGVALADHPGRPITDVLAQLGPAELALMRAVAAGDPAVHGREVVVVDPRHAEAHRVLVASYEPLVDGDGAPDGVAATIVDVTEERGRARFVDGLQRLASGLGRATTPSEVADEVLSVTIGTLGADRGAVSLVSVDGQWLDVVGSTGYRAAELDEHRLHRRLDVDDPLAEVSRSGGVLLFASDAEVRARFPAFVRRRAGGGALAAVGMPPGHVPTGGIILAWPSDRVVGDADRSFLEAASRLAGQALERVRAETVARRRAEGLARTLAAVAGEHEPASIARALLREAMPSAGAAWGAVRIVSGDGQSTSLLCREGFGANAPSADDLPLDADVPSVEAIRERREVLIPDLAASGRWPDFLAGFIADGQRASASVPILRGTRAIGCLTLGFADPQPFDGAQLAHVRALAEATAAALERARLTDLERRSRQLLTETLDQLPIGVFVAEPTGGLVFQNQETARILGRALPYGPLRDLALKRTDTGGERLAVEDWPIMRALTQGETVIAHESVVERPDGQLITVRTTARPVLGADGRVQAAVSVFSDVTRERAATEAREAFLGVLSHELRTPVTAIYGGSMLLARHRHEVPEALDPIVEDIAAESLRLLRLVEDLLVIARVERGLPVAAREPMLVGHVVRRVLAEEARRWPNVAFTSAVAPNLPPVLGDPGQLEVVLRNLLGNAAKYAGGAHVVAETVDDSVRVSVEDDGPGLDLPPEDLFRLFQRGRTAARRAAGSGIGLFVCRALIEGMGGRIWAEARPEGGTAFRFLLADGGADDLD
ncbi:MAG TPA: PAS domain-containing protein [Candidatus Limnocylindrales bacterium]|nr:PAS domain-containing protein [Candidatus Limnocylindrales bacterium]